MQIAPPRTALGCDRGGRGLDQESPTSLEALSHEVEHGLAFEGETEAPDKLAARAPNNRDRLSG